MSTNAPLDPQTQSFISRLFDLNAEAEQSGHRVIVHGTLAIIHALHLSFDEQRAVTLLFHDVNELVQSCQARCIRAVPKHDVRTT